mgnify:CR=1 FL=1
MLARLSIREDYQMLEVEILLMVLMNLNLTNKAALVRRPVNKQQENKV